MLVNYLYLTELNDPLSVINIVIYALLGLLFVLLVIALILLTFHKNKIGRYISYENTRVYIIHLSTNEITYFDQNNLHKIYKMPISRFFNQFTESSLLSIREWLNDLINQKKGTKLFLEAHVKLFKSKSTEFVLLEATSVNYEEKKIHIDSHLLPRLSPSNSKHSGRRYIITFKELTEKYNQLISSDHKRGVTCLIRIYAKQSSAVQQKNNSLNALTLQLINALTPYLSSDRYLAYTGNNEFIVFDRMVQNRSQFFSLANELTRKIDAFLFVCSLKDEYSFATGAALVDGAVKDFRLVISQCRDISYLAEKNVDNSILLYEKDNKLNSSNANKYADITSIIHNRSIRYYYTPVISAKNGSICGYFTKIKPFGTSMSYDELLQSSENAHLCASLYETIFTGMEKAIHNDESIIIKSTIPMLDNLIKNRPAIKPQHYTLSLNHQVLNVLDDVSSDLHSLLSAIKNLGFKLALYFDETPDYSLDSNDISLFDMFIIGQKLIHGIKTDNRVQADLRLLISAYSIYQKPIIASNLTTEADLEIGLASNIKYFTSDAIALPSSTFEKLNAKKIDKVISLYEQYN